MKYIKYVANSITLLALAFIAFSSFTAREANEAPAYNEYYGEGMLGEIRINGTHYEPMNWRICDGRSIEVAKNQKLYQTIGNMYGGDETNFKLPDLRSKRLFTVSDPEWDPENVAGHYMICTLGHKPYYWDSWADYYDDGVPTGW